MTWGDPGLAGVMTTIGFIGSGMIGGTVAQLSLAAGHRVVMSNSRGPETLQDLVTELGPLATARIAEDLETQVKTAVKDGATLLLGGARVAGPGNFFQPTVLAGVPRTSAVYREELFGPVSLSGLKEDRYRRVTTGMLPEADFVFLDEIFRGSSAVIIPTSSKRTVCPTP